MPSGSTPFARCILRSKPQPGRFGVILFQTDRYGSFWGAPQETERHVR
jgi:hypothetical protein